MKQGALPWFHCLGVIALVSLPCQEDKMITQNPDYLIAIVESGNLSKAAEKLFISQPSLSQYVKRLEASLGTELFDRSYSPMKLTFAGERYYDYILQMKQMELNVREELLEIQQERRGKIRLGIALWRGACLIPDVFPEFHRRFPEVSLELFEGRFSQMKNALINYEIDLMIANLLPNGSFAEFEVDNIMEEKILLAAPCSSDAVKEAVLPPREGDHPEGYARIHPDILKKIPLIATKEGQALTEIIRSMYTREHIQPEILMRTGNLTTAINLAAKGMGCTFIPAEGAAVCQRPGDIEFYELDGINLSWSLAFLYRKNSYIGLIRKGFIDCVKEILTTRI